MEDGYKIRSMKKAFNIIIGLAALVMAVASCQKEEPEYSHDPTLVGEWHLVSAEAEGESIMTDIDVYLSINEEGLFELYQMSGTQSLRYELYKGKCKTANGIVTGTYSNGKAWGAKYYYTKTADGLRLQTTNKIEQQVYVNCQIPASVKENANNVSTKAAGTAGSPIL